MNPAPKRRFWLSYTIETIAEPNATQFEAVNSLLRAHNQQANPDFWKAREQSENEPSPIHLFALDGPSEVVGGLFGTTQFNWLKVYVMAVVESARGAEIGSTLLEKAESIARERGCKRAYVDTMDYQAPKFYEKMDYAIAGQLNDWDSHGHDKVFFVKSL
jgi:GNAT superfamily N-acetyltransferase